MRYSLLKLNKIVPLKKKYRGKQSENINGGIAINH